MWLVIHVTAVPILIKVFINCKLVHAHTRIVGVVRVWFTIFIGGIALFEYCIVAVQKLILSEIISLCSRMAGTCNKFLIHLKCNCSDFLGYLFYCLNIIA